MKYAWIDEYCLSKPGVEKDYKPEWDAARYMIRGKMFAMQGGDKEGKPIFTMKLSPMDGQALRSQFKDIVPGYYMNKEHWNSLYLDGDVTEDIVKEMLDQSYEVLLNSLSKKIQQEIRELKEHHLNIRMAKEEDVPVILQFILELARFEGAEKEICSTEEGLKDILFVRHGAEALIAEADQVPVGFAIWAYSFSTFTGKPTLYIDDIYVQEPYRGKGIGSRIFSCLADIASEKDCGRMDWYCMETNLSGKEYYRKMGAEEINWFKVFRLNKGQIEGMRKQR